MSRAPRFIVRPLDPKYKGVDGHYADARAVAVFLWGKDLTKYAVYTLQGDLPSDLDDLTLVLQRSEGERAG